jgi:hypothetical protein
MGKEYYVSRLLCDRIHNRDPGPAVPAGISGQERKDSELAGDTR